MYHFYRVHCLQILILLSQNINTLNLEKGWPSFKDILNLKQETKFDGHSNLTLTSNELLVFDLLIK